MSSTLAAAISPAPVELKQLVKRFGKDVTAVNHVDLRVEPGTLVTLLGPSGCGKTTTLRMIAGLEHPTSGQVLIDDEDVTRQPAYVRDVTMVFQSYALFPHMNVFENVAYGLRVSRRPLDEIKQRVHEALSMVGLEHLSARATNALSGGQQQRVALARSLVIQPKVLLFDEPLSNLDAKLRKRVRGDIRALQQDLGITSIYVTHDQEEALAISDVVVLMNRGKIEQIGSPHELYAQPRTRFTANFVGSANFLPGQYDGKQVTLAGYRFPHEQEIAKGPVTVMVRPEAVQMSPDGEGVEATVKRVAYLGSVSECLLETPLGQIEGLLSGEGYMLAAEGEDVRVTFKPAGVYLLPAEEAAEAPTATEGSVSVAAG